MDKREIVNAIAPLYRGLGRQSLGIVAFDDSMGAAEFREDLTLKLLLAPDDTETSIVERLGHAMVATPRESLLVPGVGVFARGENLAEAHSLLSQLVGGEPEGARVPKGRLACKVAVVTGAAQGFGEGIADALAQEGAYVVIADLNEPGAKAVAQRLCLQNGAGCAIGVGLDVTNAESVAEAVYQAVRAYGGVDVFISNAGVLKAESVKTQPPRDFELVTKVNYIGYFNGVQAVAPVMALQHKAVPGVWSDVIQINSKSGLQGSNRNAAYAGSKFGGIGLTQSFALELVEDGIKVNSICPGNFFDGPLWSDPENGLFAQYLRTGKVPGAKTVEDVKRSYEAKVPMGRGCRVEDVMKAVYYIIDQQYETGQAVPVTGGQVMLS